MANEVRGELAEAIAKIALERGLQKASRPEHVFWQEAPSGSVIRPDITIGLDKNAPTHLILINASESPGNSNMKYWRNLAELFDSKSRIFPAPIVINLVFKSDIKRELIRLAEVVCDASHHVDLDQDHGPIISNWIDNHVNAAPQKRLQKAELVYGCIDCSSPSFDAEFAQAVDHLAGILISCLDRRREDLVPLWELARNDYLSRRGLPIREHRVTLLRRSLTRWLVFDEDIREIVFRAALAGDAIPREVVPDYAVALGMLEFSVAGARIPSTLPVERDMHSTTGFDLSFAPPYFRRATSGNADSAYRALATAIEAAPIDMVRAAASLRNISTPVRGWHDWVITHWEELRTPRGCFERLCQCHRDPTMNGAVDVPDEQRVWLYDHALAIIRARSGNTSIGYGPLLSYFRTRTTDPELQQLFTLAVAGLDARSARTAQRWVEKTLPSVTEPGRRGFQDWLNGTKSVSPVIVAAFSFALAGYLSTVVNPEDIPLERLVAGHSYGLWNRLLTHQDFEPLPDLIAAAAEGQVTRSMVPTIMADLAEQSVQGAGMTDVFQFSNGMIHWKSATDQGKDHKRKELSARARALRFRKSNLGFTYRPEANQLFLVIDGTFSDDDLRVLIESGWDRIFYPDEMDQLKASLV